MTHHYDIELENKRLNIGPIASVERTAKDFTFLDANGDIVALFNRDLIRSLVRLESVSSESSHNAQTQTEKTENPDDDDQPDHPAEPDSKSLSVNVASFMPEKPELPDPKDNTDILPASNEMRRLRLYQLKQNRETKGYEVCTDPRNAAQQEAAASISPSEEPKTTIKKQAKPNEQRILMTYKNIRAFASYNPVTRHVRVDKGTLIAMKETNSLRKAKNQEGVRLKRRYVLRKNVELSVIPGYAVLTEDVEFTSLSQACNALSGTVLNPAQYWNVID